MKKKKIISITLKNAIAEEARKGAEYKEMSFSEYVEDALKWQLKHDAETRKKRIMETTGFMEIRNLDEAMRLKCSVENFLRHIRERKEEDE